MHRHAPRGHPPAVRPSPAGRWGAPGEPLPLEASGTSAIAPHSPHRWSSYAL
jgi:hypothetical protein